MLILDHGNSLVYSSIPDLGSCPGLICLETTCTRGQFWFRCSLSSNDGKKKVSCFEHSLLVSMNGIPFILGDNPHCLGQ